MDSETGPGKPVTAIIAEDEADLRDDLRSRLTLLWPALCIIAEASNGIEALERFDRHKPQVMFLDIKMPGLTGLQVARQIAGRCHVVFLTAHDDFAVAAFDEGAVDYVLKPYDNERLSRAVMRVRDRLATPPPSVTDWLQRVEASLQPRAYLTWIRASRGSEIDLIMVADVCYFRADAKYTSVYTASRESLIRRSIKELAAELDPVRFWQVHRSTIVNVEAIASVSRSLIGGATVLKLKDRPERLDVSEAHRHLFRHM